MAAAIAAAFPDGTRFTSPRGGMFFGVELPHGLSSAVFFEAALDDGIRIMPGTVFSNIGRFDRFVRLSCPSADLDLVDEAVRRLGRLATRMMERNEADGSKR